MEVVDLEQAGPAWHKWRKEGIGGSDACAVVGDVQWTSPDELAEVKLGLREVEENEAMRRGKRLEPKARQLYEILHGRRMYPACVVHDQYKWLRASLDGLSVDRKLVLEIKCPNSHSHRQALEGKYPRYYKAQLYHQLMVTQAPLLHYWSFTDASEFGLKERFALVEVLPDPEYQAWLFKKEKRFLQKIGFLPENE